MQHQCGRAVNELLAVCGIHSNAEHINMRGACVAVLKLSVVQHTPLVLQALVVV